MLKIDPREGSNKLAKEFVDGEFEFVTLEFGDIAFSGKGPDGPINIGIEYKQVSDMVQCIKSGRFSGHQMPGMLQAYDICALIVEGNSQPDWGSLPLQLTIPWGKGNGARFGLYYASFDNYLTQVTVFGAGIGVPFIVKKSMNKAESAQMVRDMKALYSKPWDEHVSMRQPNRTKLLRLTTAVDLLEAKPGETDYPESVLRKSIAQIHRMSWEKAGQLAALFGNMESLMATGQKDLEALDIMGPVMAERIYVALHGYPDPSYPAKKVRKKKESENV